MRLYPERAIGMKLSNSQRGSSEAKIGAHHWIEIEPSTLQVVPSALDDDQGVRSGDRGQGVLHLWNRSERVLGPLDEQRPRAKLGKVGCPQLHGLSRRVQRIREEDQRVDEVGLVRRQDAALPAAVRDAGKRDPSADQLPERGDRGLKARAIVGRIRRPWRSCGSSLTEGKIAAQDSHARVLKGFRYRNQERRRTISAGSVRQHHPVADSANSLVQVAVDVLRFESFNMQRR
jgi:hypothetical protein